MAAANPPTIDAETLAARIEAALDRLERARDATADRQRALEAVVAGSIADLDALLGDAAGGCR